VAEKGETGEDQSQEHAHHFLISSGLFAKNSSLQTKQPIQLTTVTFYGDCVKMCKDFASNFGDKALALASGPKLVFDLIKSSVPKIMDDSLWFCIELKLHM
jgi:hypothetical protein